MELFKLINLWVLIKVGNFLFVWAIISFSWIQLHGISLVMGLEASMVMV
jgi:hypothetical protein